MGTCDRVTGQCSCVDGFEGAACDRMSCPGAGVSVSSGEDPADAAGAVTSSASTSCSGHGQCVTMSILAASSRENGVTMGYTYGKTPNDPATWDHDMVQGCLCDDGYEGHDCSLRSCPRGDDPDTHSQHNEIQEIVCLDADEDGQAVLAFRDEETVALQALATEVCAHQPPLPAPQKVSRSVERVDLDVPSIPRI